MFIIVLYLIPVWGVFYWGWTPFYVFYLFWLETLIVAVFNAIKIVGCRGDGDSVDTDHLNPRQIDHIIPEQFDH